jgi:putative molybdopterin biosynthesis protein
MSIYLHDIPLSQALDKFQHALAEKNLWRVLGDEEILLDEFACGRVLIEPVWAKLSSPHYHAAAMDGFAVRSSTTHGAGPANPVSLSCVGECVKAVYIDTGDLIPAWSDAVIPIEQTEALNDAGEITQEPRHPDAIRIRAAVTPWSHIRPMGEDIIATQLVLASGHKLRPYDLGAIAASGHDRVKVSKKPSVAIIPTGTELTPIGIPVNPGDIIEFNSIVLASQVIDWGGKATRFSPIPDEIELIEQNIRIAAKDHDLILVNAGSSAGSEDYTAKIVENLGNLIVHGVAVRPGHPVILGLLEIEDRTVPVVGVPGYPVSAALTGELFVEPLLACWLGREQIHKSRLKAELSRKITSPPGDDDYVRVAVGKINDRYLAAPLSRGAGVITSLVKADGLALIPRGSQGMPAGSPVEILLYRSKDDIDNTILIIGSHDISIDILAQYISKRGRSISSANVGSLGGLIALRNGETHAAGSHLLDPDSGEYNLPYLDRYLPQTPVIVFGFVFREQGLMVRKGNPHNILSISDLVDNPFIFVNRQRGAGTRVLFDYELTRLGVRSDQISGYETEEYSHLSVAAAVASGRADCGLGIVAAARALDLDFIPLTKERYDLIIPQSQLSDGLLDPLIELLSDQKFKDAVSNLPGYETSLMGETILKYNPSKDHESEKNRS